MAYGAGMMGWRGLRVLKAPLPFVRAAISSQSALPSNSLPNSSVAVNSPLLRIVALLVSGPAMALPPLIVPNRVNVKS